MNRTILISVLALATLTVACGGGTPASTPTPTPTAVPNIRGGWIGTFNGTNFIGAGPFTFDVNPDLTWLVSLDGVPDKDGIPTTNVVPCYIGNIETSQVRLSGSQFSASGGEYGTVVSPLDGSTVMLDSHVALTGTVNANNTGISGHFAFSGVTPAPCGSTANPWTGTFTAVPDPTWSPS
jgi:hypothetical protein